MDPEILLEDGPLLAVNKPAGLLTQGVPGGLPTLESWVRNDLRRRYSKPGNVYLGIPHRLDRPVSGVIIFARNSKAAARLAEQFRERQVRKFYVAVVQGIPASPHALLEDWLLKDAEAAHVTVVTPETTGAKLCQLKMATILTFADSAGPCSVVAIELLTGRMHQIRVQLASRGHAIFGDLQYGSSRTLPGTQNEPPGADTILLHSRQLKLWHPIRYDALSLTAPFPAFWTRVCPALPLDQLETVSAESFFPLDEAPRLSRGLPS